MKRYEIKTVDKIRCSKKLGKISNADAIIIADILIEIFKY